MSQPLFKIAGRQYTVEQLEAAVDAAGILVEAYEQGEANGGSVSWEDINAAHTRALDAFPKKENTDA